MEGSMENGLDRETAFMGKLTAGATHEMKNVLAIIGESVGLLEDLMGLPNAQDFPHRERFLKAFGSVRDQVRRGTGVLTHLNRFAHSADRETAAVNLGDLLEDLRVLSERFLRRRSISFQVVREGEGPVVETSPVRLQMLLFRVITAVAQALAEGERFQVRCGPGEGGGAAVILSWPGTALGPEGLRRLQEALADGALGDLARDLGVSLDGDAAGVRVRLGSRQDVS
jgi:signal transduction histidine kinase